MGRPKGITKTGGRLPGSKNKNDRAALRRTVEEICDAKGVDPFEVLADFLLPIDSACSPAELVGRVNHRFQAAKELATYLKPKLSAVTVTENQEQFAARSSSEDKFVEEFKNSLKIKHGDRKS